MPDSRLERLADVLVGYSVETRPGDLVLVEAPALAAPLVKEIYRRVLAAGAHPVTKIGVDEVTETLLREGSGAQLDWVNPVRVEEIERADVRIAVEGSRNTRSLSSVEATKQARVTRARAPLLNRYLERAAAGELRWVLTLYPTHAAAQDAEMSLADYEDFVFRAGFLDHEDPVESWRGFGRSLERVASFLGAKAQLRVIADGTDLTLGVAGRPWVASSGRENFPDGEVFTSPLETSVEGVISFTYPGVFEGREVADVRLRFSGGQVVEAKAARGQDLLEEMLAMDDGARRAGEFALGLNDGITVFTRNILFDEKIGGTVHLALGAAYPETGGKNSSGLHWDLICDLRSGGELYADGELVYRDGRFLDGVL